MWTGLAHFFQRIFGGGRSHEPSFHLPAEEKIREHFSRTQELEGPGGAVTARESYELAAEIITSYDPEARLTSIESTQPLTAEGLCHGWDFLFYLPQRWGQAHFHFQMTNGQDTLTVKLVPFVAKGSALAQMEEEGQSGFVEQQWNVELERNAALPSEFVDSSSVIAGYLSQTGHPPAPQAVLRAATPPLGPARWSLLESRSSKKSLYSVPIE